MTATMIQQCPLCRRFFVAGAPVGFSLSEAAAAFREGRMTHVNCQREDCAAVVASNAAQEAAQQQHRDCKPRSHRPAPAPARSTCRQALRRECTEVARSTFAARSLPPEPDDVADSVPLPQPTPLGVNVGKAVECTLSRQQAFESSGAADSANAVLLAFFRKPENFMKAFRSTDLEAMTAAAGHPSSRMNNRAIWLRKQFAPAGLYLDNDPNGQRWGLTHGSYYRLCRIEDATSLTAAEKYKLIYGQEMPPAGQQEIAI